RRHGLHHVEELLSYPGVRDREVEADQLDALRTLQILARPVPVPALIRGKKVADRHLEDCGNLPQPRGADPVGAALVFLHLLKGEPEALRELLLVQAEQQTPGPDLAADIDVNRIRDAGAAAVFSRLLPFH